MSSNKRTVGCILEENKQGKQIADNIIPSSAMKARKLIKQKI